MFDRIFKNPVSTIGGIIVGLGTYIQLAPDFHSITLTGTLSVIGTVLLGLFTKDK